MDRPRPKRLTAIPGRPPSLLAPPEGCHFRPRCPFEFEKCVQVPGLEGHISDVPGHLDRCWLTVDEKRRLRRTEDGIGLPQQDTATA